MSLRVLLLGKPDGWLIRLRCHVLGHRWWECEPECCGRTYCERCAGIK